MGMNLKDLGIPTEQDYVADYCRRTGRDEIRDWGFFIAFSMFRLAGIAQGVYKRGLDGIAISENTTRYRTYVRFLSDVAWDIVAKT
jgi:aminoglycoside phosphotransferase (APT) family kinase protein